MSLPADLRYALRTFRREPMFVAGIVLTFGLVIGTNAAMFGLVRRLMVAPPPGVQNAERVVRVATTLTEGDGSAFTMETTSYPAFRDLAMLDHTFDAVAAVATDSVTMEVNRQGYTLPDVSNGNTSVNNINFFDVPAGGVNALNFTIDNAIRTSVYNIAASGVPIVNDTLRGNNTNALLLDGIQNKVDIPGIGSIEGYLKGYVAEIGVEASHTSQMLEGEQTLVDNLTNQKTSVSGVSIDEEMTNLIKYQQSYSASARVITTIDEYLDVLINKMGLVGR
jgi:flagellar hook-associated protein FlgK